MIVETDLRKKTGKAYRIGVSGFLMRTTDPTQEAFPVKRISSNQSRVEGKSSTRPGRALERSAPADVQRPGAYEVGANTDAMSFGGIAAVHRLVTKLGLVRPAEGRRRHESSAEPCVQRSVWRHPEDIGRHVGRWART